MKSFADLIRRWSVISSAAVAGLVVTLAPSVHAEDSSAGLVAAQTKPSQEVKLSFANMGLVADVSVREGDKFKVGQVLAKQDSREDQAAYDSAKLDADSNDKVTYSQQDKKVKEIQLDRKKTMLAQHVATQQEVEEAQSAVELADTQIKLAVIEHNQKIFDAQKLAVRLSHEQLTAPFDGVVQTLNVHPGEMADPQSREGAIVVVKNDPLWVELHLPTIQSQQLHLGDQLQVRYNGDKDWQQAKVNFIRPQADAASDTQEVRLELPNPNGRDSGLQMQVKLPEKIATASNMGQ